MKNMLRFGQIGHGWPWISMIVVIPTYKLCCKLITAIKNLSDHSLICYSNNVFTKRFTLSLTKSDHLFSSFSRSLESTPLLQVKCLQNVTEWQIRHNMIQAPACKWKQITFINSSGFLKIKMILVHGIGIKFIMYLKYVKCDTSAEIGIWYYKSLSGKSQ